MPFALNWQLAGPMQCTWLMHLFFLLFRPFAQSQQIAKIYLLIIKRILERDTEFIGTERERLQKLLEGKMSERNRKETIQKLNVLSAFAVVGGKKKPTARTELWNSAEFCCGHSSTFSLFVSHENKRISILSQKKWGEKDTNKKYTAWNFNCHQYQSVYSVVAWHRASNAFRFVRCLRLL